MASLTAVSPQIHQKTEEKKAGMFAFAGLFGGSLAGMSTNFWNSSSIFSKCIRMNGADNGLCSNPLNQYDFKVQGFQIFDGINRLKQLEIKTFAFALPYFPLVSDIALTSFAKTYQEGFQAGYNELKNRLSSLSGQKLLTPFLTCMFGVLARPHVGNLLSSSDPTAIFYKFNPSGHVIAKSTAALALYESLNAVQQNAKVTSNAKERVALAFVQAVGIVATDALMMYTTGAIFHSPSELLAGGLIAAAAYPVAYYTSGFICDTAQKCKSLVLDFFQRAKQD